jgi:hypothetical protein
MVTLERIPAALAQAPDAATFRNGEAAKTQHVPITDSSFFLPMRLLPVSRRKALHPFYAFCRERPSRA